MSKRTAKAIYVSLVGAYIGYYVKYYIDTDQLPDECSLRIHLNNVMPKLWCTTYDEVPTFSSFKSTVITEQQFINMRDNQMKESALRVVN